VKKLSPIEISVKLVSSGGFLTEKVSSATTVPAWFGELIVKTQQRKESGMRCTGQWAALKSLLIGPH
jgi:hypothetical protein